MSIYLTDVVDGDQFGSEIVIEDRELSEPSVLAAASAFLAERYPEMAGEELAGLQLGSSWLIEAEATTSGDLEPYKVVMMVNRHGLVEEVGAAPTSRQTVQRCLAGLQSPAAW
ncbi:MAG: hypothetical protein ACLQVK_02995 [Acidimicrobiales bacterium]